MSNMTVLYGIKNCDSVKSARSWLEANSIVHHFHDFKLDGLSKDKLQAWLDEVGPEVLVNKRSTTWKQLSSKDQDMAMGKIASAVILANPTLIKRPVLECGGHVYVGFRQEEYESLFEKS